LADYSTYVENAKWSSLHSWIFTAFCVGTLLEAYIYSLPYIATTWVKFPIYLIALISVWSPLWLLVGGIAAGPLADRIGRKKTFYVTLSTYVVGALVLIAAYDFVEILIALAILLLAAGGEYNTILVSTHELFPKKHRSKALYLELNFTNVGGIVATALAIVAITSVSSQKLLLGISVIAVALVIFLIRLRLPESVMWLEKSGEENTAGREFAEYYDGSPETVKAGETHFTKEAEPGERKHPGKAFRLAVGGIIGWSYTAGFSLGVLAIGPYFFPSLTDYIILISGVSAFLGGFIGIFSDRLSRRNMLTYSIIGMIVVTFLFIVTEKVWLVDMIVFWLLFVVLNIMINIFFLTEDTLKSEVWPVKGRGTFTGIVRVISLGGSIPVIFLASELPIGDYLWAELGIFALGLAAAVAWRLRGVETGEGQSVRMWG
jgi:MFS family permease